MLCVLNPHGNQARGADVLVDAALNPVGGQLTVVLNTAQAGKPEGYSATHATGSTLDIMRYDNGSAYVQIRELGPSEIVVLSNHPTAREGGIRD